jgi:hypothetical protein
LASRACPNLCRSIAELIENDKQWRSSVESLQSRLDCLKTELLTYAVGISHNLQRRAEQDFVIAVRNVRQSRESKSVSLALSALQKSVDVLDGIKKGRTTVGNLISNCSKEFANFNPLSATANPELKLRYQKAQAALAEAKNALETGNLNRADSQIKYFELEFTKVKQDAQLIFAHASEEIGFWQCLNKNKPFLPDSLHRRLRSFPEAMSSDDVQRWVDLRLEIEDIVLARAAIARTVNAHSMGVRYTTLQLKWDDSDAKKCESFAHGIGRKLQKAKQQIIGLE